MKGYFERRTMGEKRHPEPLMAKVVPELCELKCTAVPKLLASF
jgi:hypothetical protein